MKQIQQITQWIFEGEGDHHGHVFVKDRFGIDFHGYAEATSYYCIDCKVSVTVTDDEPQEQRA